MASAEDHTYPEQPERLTFTEPDEHTAPPPVLPAPGGLDAKQLRELIVSPTLVHLGLYSVDAVELLINTALQESKLRWIQQLGRGPAVGLWQMEPVTHDDIWHNYLAYREELADKVRVLAIGTKKIPDAAQMAGNLFYAAAMARIHYFRVAEALPFAGDIAGQASYWKRHYNTELGRGTVEEFMDAALTA